MTKELKPCPFCGKEVDLSDPDTLYPSGTGWKFDEELQMRTYHNLRDVPEGQWCWGMHCPTNSGGCGIELHGDSRDEAIAKWNTRAQLQPLIDAHVQAAMVKAADVCDSITMLSDTDWAVKTIIAIHGTDALRAMLVKAADETKERCRRALHPYDVCSDSVADDILKE